MGYMRHKLRDLIILLISLSGLSYLYRAYYRRNGPLVRALCFHDVADARWFEEVIKMIVQKYQLITPAEFKAKKFSLDKINILLTFDDGYQTWIDNCLPVLNKYQAKGIFFINSGLLDIADDSEKVKSYMKERLLISPKKPLTWEGVKQLVNSGHTIGGHTVSHPDLARLSESEAVREINLDKHRFESELDITLQDFAYPFGTRRHITNETINFTETVYSYKYSAMTGFVEVRQNQLIPRTLIENNQPLPQIKSWILGSYDVFNILTK